MVLNYELEIYLNKWTFFWAYSNATFNKQKLKKMLFN